MGCLRERARLVSPLRTDRRNRAADARWRGIVGLRNANSITTANDCTRDSGREATACGVLVARFLEAGHIPDGHAERGTLHELAGRSSRAASPICVHLRLPFAL